MSKKKKDKRSTIRSLASKGRGYQASHARDVSAKSSASNEDAQPSLSRANRSAGNGARFVYGGKLYVSNYPSDQTLVRTLTV